MISVQRKQRRCDPSSGKRSPAMHESAVSMRIVGQHHLVPLIDPYDHPPHQPTYPPQKQKQHNKRKRV